MLQRRRLGNSGVALPAIRRERRRVALAHPRGRIALLAVWSHGRGRGASASATAAIVRLGEGSGAGGVLGPAATPAVRAPAAAENAEDEEAAYTGDEADEERQVVVDPGADVDVAAALVRG